MKTTNQTKGIGFKNFRRFENFPMLEFGNITYMVGRNNSGKSTMVKALLLVMDYLQNQLSDTFSFDNKVLEDANIVTFGRAKNNKSKDPIIKFELQLDEFQLFITIHGQGEDTKAKLYEFCIYDSKSGINLNINYTNRNVSISKQIIEENKKIDDKSSLILQLERSVNDLKEEIEKIDDKASRASIELMDSYRKTSDKLKDAYKSRPKETKKIGDTEYVLSYSLDLILEDNSNDNKIRNDNKLVNILEQFIWINNIESGNKAKEKISKNKKEDVLELSRNNSHISSFSKRIIKAINQEYFYYIAANPSKQSALFYLRDKNNALSQAIHNFYQLVGVKKNVVESDFVIDWMKKFEVGVDYEINMHAGEAYEFNVIENGQKVQLADKGMGSLQIMTLILKIASLIKIKNNQKSNRKIFTILIEEPELNLHPKLQSKLTNFFQEINKLNGFQFIIETHSEYVIRQSQLLGLEQEYFTDNELNVNPFKIYYFHKEEGPYEMIYKENGSFKRNFGEGFLDVVDNIALEMFLQNNPGI